MSIRSESIFENRKKRLLREFAKTFPGQTPPTTDEEVHHYLDEEQFLAVRSLVNRQYSWWHPTLDKPTSREAILAIRQCHLGEMDLDAAHEKCTEETGKKEIIALARNIIEQQKMTQEQTQ